MVRASGIIDGKMPCFGLIMHIRRDGKPLKAKLTNHPHTSLQEESAKEATIDVADGYVTCHKEVQVPRIMDNPRPARRHRYCRPDRKSNVALPMLSASS